MVGFNYSVVVGGKYRQSKLAISRFHGLHHGGMANAVDLCVLQTVLYTAACQSAE